MTSLWRYRLYIIVPVTVVDEGNALWTLIGPEGDDEADTFGVPLSASGNEPATHRGVDSAFNAEMLALLRTIEDTIPGLTYYVADAWSFALLEQFSGNLALRQPAAFHDALIDQSLNRIRGEV